MLTYVIRRLLQTIPILLGVIMVVFLIMQLVPGDPALLLAGEDATPEKVALIRQQLGLDRPLFVQYVSYVANVLHGDLGVSWRTGLPVREQILTRLPTTVVLGLSSVCLAVTLGMSAGILAATKQHSKADIFVMIGALLGVSVPSFWQGLLLIYIFSVKLKVFPVAGWGTWEHIVLPTITLGTAGAAIIARQTRSSMLEVIRQDYIRTAKAKGLKDSVIIYKHALKNALIPVITVVGVQIGILLGGAVVTESVFTINGLGRLTVDAITMRDLPVIQGGVLTVATIFVMVNLIVDILYKYLNKRIELN